MAYGFIRNTNTWGVNSIPWQDLIAAGLTPLLAANDPNLAAAMAAAQQKGVKAGIWVPAGDEGLPEQYAAKLVDLYKKYGPNVLVPNIEFTGKGYEGSAGWNWNQRMVNELVKLGIPPQMAVAVLPNQQDFNYKAYTDRGIHVLPEAFGANTGTDLYDPQKIRQTLLDRGVPANMIDVLLAPSQVGKGPGGSVFTIDDLSPEQLHALRAAGVDTGAATTTQASPDATPSAEAPVDSTPTRVADADNPAAVAYAKQRLALLAKQGYSAAQYGLEGLDPTAQWRALSSIAGAKQAIRNGQAGNYHLGANVPPSVAAAVNQLLDSALHPDNPADLRDNVRPGQVRPSVAPTSHPTASPNVNMTRPNVVGEITRGNTTSPDVLRAITQVRRTPPGELVDAVKRIGPMQQAIHTAAGLRYLRGI